MAVQVQGLDAIAAREGMVRVIARVPDGEQVPESPAGGYKTFGPPAAPARAVAIEAAKARVVTLMRGARAALVKPLPRLPFVVLEVDRADLRTLIESGLIVDVQEDVAVPPTLPQSGPLVGADLAWGQGARGGGRSVAILDSGVASAHPFLLGRIVAEACFSSNSVAQGATTMCPNGQTQQTGVGSAAPCAIAGCNHGTHVAGIAAGRGANFSGMAPDSNIVPVQVFSRFTDAPGGPTPCANLNIASPCILSFTSDQLQGLTHVRDNAVAQNISAANMSLGGGRFLAACNANALAPMVQTLRNMGVATVISSGNNGYSDAVGSPGCIGAAVTVGSTTKQDAVSSFSNSSPLVDLLAPGSNILSSVPGGGFAQMSGTSMAAPHVAGAFAVMASALPNQSIDTLEGVLTGTGIPIKDARNNLTIPRLALGTAVACQRAPAANRPLGLYRPGTGTIWLMAKDASGAIRPFYRQGDPGAGIGGYDLKSSADRVFTFDYNGTGKADHLVLYRPGTGTIWMLGGACAGFRPVYQQGDPGNGIGGYDLKSAADQAFAFDYDGSGKRDHLALYRPGTGTFWILRKNAAGTFAAVYQQGDPGAGIGGYDLKSSADRAFAFDYDSSGKMDDIVLYRPGTGTLWILRKNGSGAFVPVYNQGDPGNGIGGYDLKSAADRVIAFDYNSSGRMDHLVLYRAGTGTVWILRKNASGQWSAVYQQGDPGAGIGGYDLKSSADRIVAVDFQGTGKFDHLALYRPGTGTIWILQKSAAGNFTPVYQQGDPGLGIGGYDLRSASDLVFAPGGS
jgi:subtilisin family serine protease